LASQSFLATAFVTASFILLCPLAVSAQIYVWRDAAGNLVLSDKAKDPSARTYGVAPRGGVTTFKATRPLTGRAAKYQALIEEHAAINVMSADLVRAVIQAESAYNPRALSPKGAMGLMQLMPATAAELGVLDAYDPAENIRAGVRYLKKLLDTYGGKVELALAAYNAGPGAVKKYGGTVPPYRETRNYVARVQDKVKDSAGTSGLSEPRRGVYRTVEVVNGREVVRYTDTPREGSKRVTAADRR
jgi:soluble lytic murein transglycosylase-like protein